MEQYPELRAAIETALFKAKSVAVTRENALVVTKIQEALLWHDENVRNLQDLARRQIGMTTTEPSGR